ncbi:ABC transporter permease [Ferrimonas gelatinilytica]|uniref:FtsX-like permease family protein n=1 Tax=Ferrimonas gelatinilytica TaxID=1255257 RepID=A0ABP9RZV1_9GAMM
MSQWGLAWRLFRRELRGGQLRLITAALALAVLSVTSLGLVTERLKQGLNEEATRFLAADRVLQSPQEVDPLWLERAEELGLSVAKVLSFQSMAFIGDQLQLVSVRAVTDNYPLKGQIEPLGVLPGRLPQSGTLWFDSRLHHLAKTGQTVELGDAQLRLSGSFARLPDGGFNLFASAPLVLMRMQDVEQTGVVQPGSRLTWRYQFAGAAEALAQFESDLLSELTSSQRWLDVRNQGSPLSRAIGRAEQFMLMATLLGIALACAAVGVAARRYCQRHFDVVAMFKTLGATHRQVRMIFVFHLGLTTLMGIAIGTLLGILLALGMGSLLADALPMAQTLGWRPLILGAATGVVAGIGFTLYPLLRLLRVAPLRVLRRDLEPTGLAGWLNGLFALAALALLAWLYSGSVVMTLVLLAGALALALLLGGVGFVVLSLGRQLGVRTGSALQLALAGLRRRARENLLQLVGFTVALMLLLTVLALRQDLLEDWQQQLPEGTPDHFLVNVAPDLRTPISDFLAERQVEATDLYPVIRGRLSAINGERVQGAVSKEEDDEEASGPDGIRRELSLTYRAELPPNNPVVAGRWFGPNAVEEVSVESEVAERLGVGLGSRLQFVIGGRTLEATVTSLRQVNWETMQPNFFFIFPEATLSPFYPTYIASFKHPEGDPELVAELVRLFPTVSVIDVGAMIAQLREVVDQVSLALAWVLLVVAIASSLLLMAQTEAGMASRRQELGIMRTLGAAGRLLRRAVGWEFFLLGLLSGLLAVCVAELLLVIIKTQLFDLRVQWHGFWWWTVPPVSGLLIGLLGLWSCRRLLAHRCAELLQRQA